jgi:adenylosuccinate lyase
MAYKRNPMRAERINALARHVIALTMNPAMTASHAVARAHARRFGEPPHRDPGSLPRHDAVLLLMQNVATGLVVRPAVIRRHLLEELPFMVTERS